MSAYLLDVSTLIALVDTDHEAHDRVHEWFEQHAQRDGWASCAITENGFGRVISQPRYRNPISAAEAVDLLTTTCESQHHRFWPCDASLRTSATRLLGASQVTDVYLLALAIAHGGRFATLDRTVSLASLVGASEDHLVVP